MCFSFPGRWEALIQHNARTSNQFTSFDFAPKLLFLFRFYFSVFDSRQKKILVSCWYLDLSLWFCPGQVSCLLMSIKFLFHLSAGVTVTVHRSTSVYDCLREMWTSLLMNRETSGKPFFFLLCVFCFAVTFSHFNSFIQTNVCYCYSTNILHQTVLSYWSDSF